MIKQIKTKIIINQIYIMGRCCKVFVAVS